MFFHNCSYVFFFSSRRRHTRCALVTGVQTCALPIYALSEATLHASNPDNQQVPQELELVSNLDWRDQYVLAAGVAYQWSDRMTIRLGYNYGRNPIPKATMNPVLAATSSRTYSLGLRSEERRVGKDCVRTCRSRCSPYH